MDLKQQLLAQRLKLYVDLRGGFSFPVAGAIWWSAMAGLGYFAPLKTWALCAFIASGFIFPLAILVSRLARVDFLNAKSAVDTVMGPAFVGMLLFWPIAFAAYWSEVSLTPLILAIGLAMHWPVIGWSYGRSALYSAHAIARGVSALALWVLFPEHRTTWLPASVALIYALTIVAILIDVSLVRAKLRNPPA
jgi:hypothetical protein